MAKNKETFNEHVLLAALSLVEEDVSCKICKKHFTIVCNEDGLDKWRWPKYQPIQDVLPSLTPDERVLMETAVCSDCMKKIRGE